MVWQVYEAVSVPIIAMGGIMQWQDAAEFVPAAKWLKWVRRISHSRTLHRKSYGAWTHMWSRQAFRTSSLSAQLTARRTPNALTFLHNVIPEGWRNQTQCAPPGFCFTRDVRCWLHSAIGVMIDARLKAASNSPSTMRAKPKSKIPAPSSPCTADQPMYDTMIPSSATQDRSTWKNLPLGHGHLHPG